MKQCNMCKETKELAEFNKASTYKDKIYYRGECRSCNLKMQASNQSSQIKYRNSDKGKKAKSDYKKTDKYKAYQKEADRIRAQTPERKQRIYEWTKMKLETDPLFRLKFNMRNRVRNAFKSKKWNKNSSISKHIGCTLEELKNHIQIRFTIGMTWENYGKWELDHIVPISSAKTVDEMYKLCHYTNLQPLWRIDNIKKSNKI